MGKLKDLCTELEGDDLAAALIDFEYGSDNDAVVDADTGSSEWYNGVDDRPLGGPDTIDELMALVASGVLDLDVYEDVINALSGVDDENEPEPEAEDDEDLA